MWAWGDSFDLYAAPADAFAGYWDSGVAPAGGLVAGRFTGGQALRWTSTTGSLTKASGSNDAVHHIVCAFQQTAVLSGTTLGLYIQLSDGATNQCCIVFRSDGAILLTSATPAGTVLATYTGAVTVQNQWFAFEIEVVINNTTGSFAVRTNGATSNSFSATALNTRPGTNNYANKITVGMQAAVNAQQIDDLLWRSDPSSVPWVGDIRCYTRMPASDQAVQFSRLSPIVQSPFAASTTAAVATGTARYSPFTATVDGTVGTATITLGTGYTGNLKCSLFASSGSAPTTVLSSATNVVNPAAGANIFTFGTPVSVTRGTQYWLGFSSDTSSGTWSVASGTTGTSSTTAYASFPAASPTTSAAAAVIATWTITATDNYSQVNDAQQDGVTSYVYDNVVGHNDFYSIASIPVTPASIVAVTTRGFAQKSDAGSRTGAMQLQSGATNVQSTIGSTLLTTWAWMYRTDLTDPATSAAWTPTGVNNAQIGPVVLS